MPSNGGECSAFGEASRFALVFAEACKDPANRPRSAALIIAFCFHQDLSRFGVLLCRVARVDKRKRRAAERARERQGKRGWGVGGGRKKAELRQIAAVESSCTAKLNYKLPRQILRARGGERFVCMCMCVCV